MRLASLLLLLSLAVMVDACTGARDPVRVAEAGAAHSREEHPNGSPAKVMSFNIRYGTAPDGPDRSCDGRRPGTERRLLLLSSVT